MEELFLKKEDGVGILTINRADKMNAMTRDMWAELNKLVREVRDDEEVKVLVLTGTRQAFCTGADVGRMGPRPSGERPQRSRRAILRRIGDGALLMKRITKPIIGAINGITAGAGVSLALLCDIRIASDQARFAASWVKRGLVPDMGGTWLLPRTIGMEQALEIMFIGDTFDAAEALRIGLVGKVVPNDDLMNVSLELAGKLAQGPTIALDFIKRAAYRSLYNSLDQQLDFESWGQSVCVTTEDFREGVLSFQEKRPPVFRGR